MRLLSVFRKTIREQWRDKSTLAMTLIAAPLFMFLYFLMMGGASTSYTVLLLDQDQNAAVADAVRTVKYEDGSPLLKVRTVSDRAAAEKMLRDREGDALLLIPQGFGSALKQGTESQYILSGDLTNPRYTVTAILAATAVDGVVQAALGPTSPIKFVEEPLGGSGSRTEFESYVPGLLMIAVEMLMFKFAMMLAAEVEAGTLRRLRLTRMTALDLLGGISLSQMIVGVVAVLLAFGTAMALGFESQGPLWVAMLVTTLTTFSIIGFGLLTACFAHTTTQASVIATFPMLAAMFFSGSAFPLPKVPLFSMLGRAISIYDILPPTHAVSALNKVLTMGAGISEIGFELAAIVILSAGYFMAGVWLFHRRHMRVQL
ncbi:MAG TPA: ABC transporter permease [Symbiobacteriaceae bacterium]|nr:ABC transporter permease [Symbiobacteriaceae bacterium]